MLSFAQLCSLQFLSLGETSSGPVERGRNQDDLPPNGAAKGGILRDRSVGRAKSQEMSHGITMHHDYNIKTFFCSYWTQCSLVEVVSLTGNHENKVGQREKILEKRRFSTAHSYWGSCIARVGRVDRLAHSVCLGARVPLGAPILSLALLSVLVPLGACHASACASRGSLQD